MPKRPRTDTYALFGQRRLRPTGFVGLAVGLFLLGIVIGELPLEWLPVIGGDTLLWGFVLTVIVAGGNAYWNDGFLPGLGLAFAVALGAWWGPYLLPPTSPGIGLEGAILFRVALALLTAVGAGIVGYAGGLLLRPDGENWILDLLVGPNRTKTLVGIAGAIGLFILGIAIVFYIHESGNLDSFRSAHAVRDYFRLADIRSVPSFRTATVLAWVALPAAYAYWNDGLIVEWALVFGLAYGYNIGFEATHQSSLGSVLRAPLVQVLIHTVILGTIGFVAGASFRRLIDRSGGRLLTANRGD